MYILNCKLTALLIVIFSLRFAAQAQNTFAISGKLIDAATKQPLSYATVHLVGNTGSTLSKEDGSFRIITYTWYDSLQISMVGYELFKIFLQKQHTGNLVLELKNTANSLQTVTVSIAKKPGKTFMEKVIEHKQYNNPDRFHAYTYQRYTRNELDLNNLDYKKMNKKGMKSLMASIYSGFDSSSKYDKELPIYFSEVLANNYHSISPKIDRETLLAKKSLGLKTDDLLRHLEKFYFFFNVYDNWIPVFDQTFVSPLNNNAFSYYNFFSGDTIVENGITIRQIRFVPQRAYERAFTGTLWINDSTYAIENVNMHLSKTSNLNFVKDIDYSEEYKQVYDSTTDNMVYMPLKYSSEVKFEAGLSLLGIPVPENKESLQLVTKSTTVLDKVIINTNEPGLVIGNLMNIEKVSNYEKPDGYWAGHRLDSLTKHEKGIYLMVDSLQENKRFQRNIKLIAFAGTGYWDLGNQLRIGPYSSFISSNSIEGLRFRAGFWTMPGINKRLNFYGYGAYGTKDRKLKGGLGLKYVWNDRKWTKTSMWFGSDYDFIIGQNDELDKDNIISSFLRKNIPYARTYVKQVKLKHEQYLNKDFSAKASIGYKELNPVFDFSYNPINPVLEKPIDSVSLKILPVGEVSIGLRYAHKERTTILNYDQIRLGTFSPVFTLNFTHGFELSKTHLDYDKINIGIEQQLHLPPKLTFYYCLDAGKVFGTIPYLLLNIPAGNEYYVSSRYEYNTMTPYEFSADRYFALHTRLSIGGALFDKIHFLQKLGWRELISYNMYWGDMTHENMDYNKKANFNIVGKQPFMEAGIGVDNIFHILSIEYYRRFTQLTNPYAKKYGIYLGVHLVF
ncbi:MAG: carboxypeptidase-like regulatory domain-containing protein [Bacteroidetes bacterium]|nr:carboxypeptidase-like regulatory domain-containing protein [Bacteroidota bacterium]